VDTKKPPTLIHSPFAKATRARDITKLGNMAVTKTTSDSAATRSRKIHITQVKKASAVGVKFDNQYETIENRSEIRTAMLISDPLRH
jgi:predicted kinase